MARWLVVLALVAAPAVAVAQTDASRIPEGTSLATRKGHPDQLLMGMTIGPLMSDDGGQSWYWYCENAVGYGGTYDPHYLYSPSGAVFATTFNGIAVMRDGCVWETTPLGKAFAANLTQGPDDRIFVAMSFPGDQTATPPLPEDHKIYRSTNDGVSWDAGVTPGSGGETWTTIAVAPSDAQRVYLTGYRIEDNGTRTIFLYRSINGGDTYSPLPITDFTLTDQSALFVMAISQTDPQRLLLRVTRYRPNNMPGDEYFITTNGGTSWTSVLQTTDLAPAAAFLANGDAVIGTRSEGTWISNTGGTSFAVATGPQPQVYCLHERPDGELWACTEPYTDPAFDGGVFKTTSIAPPAWSVVMRYQDDILDATSCPPGTIQHDCCYGNSSADCAANHPEVEFPTTWCRVRTILQIGPNPTGCDAPDASMAGADSDGQPPKGCCDTGGGGNPVGPLALAGVVAWRMRRRRRPAL